MNKKIPTVITVGIKYNEIIILSHPIPNNTCCTVTILYPSAVLSIQIILSCNDFQPIAVL
jgi:hypothetical protein